MTTEKFLVTNLGINHPDYFPGDGVAYTPFSHCVIGIGDTSSEAYHDAVEQIYTAFGTVIADSLSLPAEHADCSDSDPLSSLEEYSDSEDFPYYYVSIKF